MINNVVLYGVIFAIVFFVIVTALKTFIALTEKDHRANIALLHARAEIIVRAIDQTQLENTARKALAITKLGQLAEEWKIPLSTDQASDYIESAVNTVRSLQNPTIDE